MFWKKLLFGGLLPTLVFGIAAAIFVGCEDEGSTDDDADALDQYFADHPYVSDPRVDSQQKLTMVEPQQSATEVGQTLMFEVQGGTSPFTWSVTDGALGTLAKQGNQRQAIYTCKIVGDNYVLCHDSRGFTGLGKVNGSPVPLTVSPSSATMVTNVLTYTFEAAGGTPPYAWSKISGPGAVAAIDGQGKVAQFDRSAGETGVTFIQVEDSTPLPYQQVKTAKITLEW